MTEFQIGTCIFLSLSVIYQIGQGLTMEKMANRLGSLIGAIIYVVIIVGLISKW